MVSSGGVLDMDASILAAFATMLTPLTALAAYIAFLYRGRIAELEQKLDEAAARERKILQVILTTAEDEEEVVRKLAEIIAGGDSTK